MSPAKYHSCIIAWREAHLIMPEPKQFEPLETFNEDLGISLADDFKEKGLQVIVKLANIQLTPEKPTYDGGSWHVEGQLVGFYPFISEFNLLLTSLSLLCGLERAHLCNCDILLRLPEYNRQPSFLPPAVQLRRRLQLRTR